ncbi:MAG: hypothetical protein K2K71_02325 [Eubacterium sp.]|nr:hypothetical protein [Eubacterium sp.]
MQKKVTITQEEYEEYRKLRKYKRMVSDKYNEQKPYICQLKILTEALFYSVVNKDDIVGLIFNNVYDLYNDSIEFGKLVSDDLDFTAKM